MRKIVTSPTHSPLPSRQHDWCAHYDGEEEAGNYGFGATETEAVADFIENCQTGHDERLDDPTGTYPLKRWWPDAVEITPHDVAQLAETRRRDPELALRIAEESARSSSLPKLDTKKEARISSRLVDVQNGLVEAVARALEGEAA